MSDDKLKLEKILDCLDQIADYTKDGKDAFFTDRKTQDAVVRNLQVIGQAIKDLSVELKEQNPDVEWRKASRMRDKITHDYLFVDYATVWDTVGKSLPPFREQVEDIHRKLVYKVAGDRPQASKLEERLKSEDET